MNDMELLERKISFKVDDIVENFKIISIDRLDEYHSFGIRAIHQKSGLEAYHFLTDDSENLFSFSFKTPPSDDSGVPHIIEHSVLSGSKRFPIKDPFQAFLKGSVNTFLNAMTYPEKTLYPAASVLEKDYFNLMDVYGDAVFNPLLTKQIFSQEAYHIEEDKNGKYFAKGVVFNEMLGSFSDKERLMFEKSSQVLFPESTYRFDSGGLPSAIPELDHASFLEFYKRFYHPINCRLFLYGDIDTAKQFKFLDERFLAQRDVKDGAVAPEIEIQKSWDAPRSFLFNSPASDDDDGLAMVTVNWIIGEVSSPKKAMLFDLLSSILLANHGSPLYKGIIETGLGEDLSPASGVDNSLRQAVFTCGLRGVKPNDCEGFASVVIKVLEQIIKDGISKSVIEGTLRQFEFKYREVRGGMPNGLRMADRALDGWLHGKDPSQFLIVNRRLAELRDEIESTPRFFESLIEELLLSNTHRAEVIIVPDANETKVQADLLDSAVMKRVEIEKQKNPQFPKQEVEAFYRYQEQEDSEEDLAKMPKLSRDDLKRNNPELILEEIPLDRERSLFFHNHFCNQITYFSAIFDLSGFSDEELLFIPLLAKMMSSSSLPNESVQTVAENLSLLTGGFYPFSESGTRVDGVAGDGKSDISTISFKVKMLDERVGEALPYILNLLKSSQMDDLTRLKDVIMEMRNDYLSSIVPEATQYALSWAKRELSPSYKQDELWRGLSQYGVMDICSDFNQEQLKRLASFLSGLRSKLLQVERFSSFATGERILVSTLTKHNNLFISDLLLSDKQVEPFGIEKMVSERFNWYAKSLKSGEAHIFELKSGVAYNAMVLPAVRFMDKNSIPMAVLSKLLNSDYLWSNIRMKGGAYGAYSSINSIEGFFIFGSYRDPESASTLSHFRNSLEWVIDNGVDSEEIEKAIITLVGREMRPLKSYERGATAYRRNLYGITEEMRQERREELLGVNSDDIRASAKILLNQLDKAKVVILAGQELLEKENPLLGEFFADNSIARFQLKA